MRRHALDYLICLPLIAVLEIHRGLYKFLCMDRFLEVVDVDISSV